MDPSPAPRTALVTGANAGLGFEVSRALSQQGWRVLMACRNAGRAQAAATALSNEAPSGSLEVRPLDLSSLRSVRELAARIEAEEPTLELLVNNAGVMAHERTLSEDGFEIHLGVNHLGHAALTFALLSLLSRSNARVVTVSSLAHRYGRIHLDDLMLGRTRGWFPAYAQSKLANLCFTYELALRAQHAGLAIESLAAHPGGSRTHLGHDGPGFSNLVMRTLAPFFTQSARSGAVPILRAALDPEAQAPSFFGPRYGYLGLPPRVERPSSKALDPATNAALWERTCELVGIDPGI